MVELASVTANLERGVRQVLPHVGSVTVVVGSTTSGASQIL